MKLKTIILVIIAFIIIILVNNKQESIVIPKESIRIRILSNSNSDSDISKKMEVKENIEKEIYNLLKNVSNIDEAREILNNNLNELNIIIDNTVDEDYTLAYGYNYFPRKIYKGIIYDEGVYESLVITLGSGKGDNWWCVLFPPLCLLDENENTTDVEYQFFIKELLEKYI